MSEAPSPEPPGSPAGASSRDDEGVFEPFAVDAVPGEEYAHGERFGARFRSLGDFGGGEHVGVSMEALAPGKQAYPAHYHMLEEEHLLVLEGALTLRLGERSYEMKAGDYVCFHAGQPIGHAMFNHTASPCRYLIIGERDGRDVVVHTDTGRVGVRLMGEGYRRSASMEYWDGEP
jgi:uncharacterized cupin superfamily protein